MTTTSTPSVLILGGDLAGLTAAYRLASKGCRVTLADFAQTAVDPIEHLEFPPFSMLGCHHAAWALLRSTGIATSPNQWAESSLEFLLPNGRLARYPRSLFPNPLHQVLTISRFTGLSLNLRWKLLSWLEQIWEGSLQLATDLEHRTAQDWIISLNMDPALARTIWNPLALWLTGCDLHRLSADAFVAALTPYFLAKAEDNRIHMPRFSWKDGVVRPIMDRIVQAGGTFLPALKSVGLDYQAERVTGVRFADGSRLEADWYISALAINRLTPLLPERWLSRYAYFQQITELTTIPWTAIEIPVSTAIHRPRTILIGTGPIPLILCRPSSIGQGLSISLLRSGQENQDDLDQVIAAALRTSNLPEPAKGFSESIPRITTYHTLALFSGTKLKRPIQRSPISNLLVAGAWTDTGWPANLESAVVSGERCAEVIAGERQA